MKKRESEISTVLLKGAISNLQRSRRSHDFVLTQVQQQQVGATALAASAMGMGAAGIGLIGMAADSDEEADWVEFEVGGNQVQGWLWMMPMRNGDEVEVVAVRIGDNRYIAYAVKRHGDDLLAVYPHATAGRKVHFRRSVKTWFWFSMVAYSFFPLFTVLKGGWSAFAIEGIQVTMLLGLCVWGLLSALIAFRISRKFMGFVKIAETIFKTFNWPDVENIDLRKTSRENRRENRAPNFGSLYFRYK
jgi:hypothetical protein